MPFLKHQLTVGTRSVKCDSCGKEWKYQTLCPICWNETLQAMIDNHWKCLKCGTDLLVEQDANEKVQKIICPKCRVIYTHM